MLVSYICNKIYYLELKFPCSCKVDVTYREISDFLTDISEVDMDIDTCLCQECKSALSTMPQERLKSMMHDFVDDVIDDTYSDIENVKTVVFKQPLKDYLLNPDLQFEYETV